VLSIFRLYKQSIERSFDPQDITLLVSGTLIILISCLFMNGGAGKEIVYVDDYNSPNNIVMNTVIAASTGGLTMVLLQQYTNIFEKEQVVQ
jgi:ammonia channel protein AmtB